MKLLLASAAAALMATSFGASAADLAKKAPVAVDYVKVCDAYGAGFFYIPGSDTCLKIGGYVRADVVGGDDDFGKYGGDRDSNNFTTRARLQLQVDARTNTSFGLLRSYAAANFQFDTGVGHNAELDQAYIQWGGLTAGKAQSYFDFFTGYAPAFVYGETVHDDKVNMLAYTFAFSGGLSATLSLEDSTVAGRLEDGSTPGSAFAGTYGGNKLPDFIANLKLEQGWGTAQVMGVLHQAYSDTNVIDEMGFAIGAGVTIKLPTLGEKDEFGIQVAYADGAVRYLGFDLTDSATAAYDFNVLGDRSKGWSGLVGYQHSFSSKVVGVVQGGYVSFDSASNADDYSRWDATAGLIWTPVDNLDISTFVEYRSNDFDAKADTDGFAVGLRLQRTF
jgi:hypothetical protein